MQKGAWTQQEWWPRAPPTVVTNRMDHNNRQQFGWRVAVAAVAAAMGDVVVGHGMEAPS